MQANGKHRGGGLVGISGYGDMGISGGTGDVSVVGSTLTNIKVRAHWLSTFLKYPLTVAPVRLLHTAQCRTACAASTRSTLLAYRLGAVLTAHWRTAGYRWWAPAQTCVACGMQAVNSDGGLVDIQNSGTGHVSVVGSTLTNMEVREHCMSTR
jgi:hypothetical protein